MDPTETIEPDPHADLGTPELHAAANPAEDTEAVRFGVAWPAITAERLARVVQQTLSLTPECIGPASRALVAPLIQLHDEGVVEGIKAHLEGIAFGWGMTVRHCLESLTSTEEGACVIVYLLEYIMKHIPEEVRARRLFERAVSELSHYPTDDQTDSAAPDPLQAGSRNESVDEGRGDNGIEGNHAGGF